MIPLYILVLVGVSVGALTGITGSSGVLIVVPALIYLGLTYYDAIGSSLLVDVITTLSVVFVYFRHGNVNYKVSFLLGSGAIIGAQLGSRIALSLPEKVLEIAFTIFTITMAIISFRRARNPNLRLKRINIGKISYPLSFFFSVIVGIVTGTLGASGGIMFVAILMLLYSMDVKKMIGTATFAMLFSAISGTVAYFLANKIDLISSLVIGSVALVSGFYFAKLANKMKQSSIYMFLGSVFVLTTISELIKII